MRCQHGNLLLNSEVWPEGQTPYCRICWLNKIRPKRIELPCYHRGRRVFPPEAPDTLRDWVLCEKGHGVVCSCLTCNSTCSDYEADDVVEPLGELTYEIKTDGRGIGDAVSQLYACVGLVKKTNANVIMRSRHMLSWFHGISYPKLVIQSHDGSGFDCNVDYYGQLNSFKEKMLKARTEWYCRNIAQALNIEPFEPALPEVKKTFKKLDLPFEDYVVIAPYSLAKDREWPAYFWVEFILELRKRGIYSYLIGIKRDELRLQSDFAAVKTTYFLNESPEFLTSLLRYSRFFIGNDSGMAHIASLYQVPTYTLMGQLTADFVFYPNPYVVGIMSQTHSCSPCAWQTDCPTLKYGYCGALHSITPEQVFEVIEKNGHL
jgi:hypothetical protein